MGGTRTLASFLHLPKRTLRVQLTLLYGGVFFVLCVALLTIANIPVLRGSSSIEVHPVPGGSAIAQAQHGADVHQLVVGSVIALVVSVALSLALGWLIAGRLLRPLRAITTTAREISASNLHRRLALTGPDDEFKELGDTLDDLFGRLEASFESQRHFVANASHELRTPLSAERSLLQVALADAGADVDTLRATCEEVLLLGSVAARSPSGTSHRGRAPGSAFRGDLPRRPTVGDPSLIESLVANLVDNALRHNIEGGWIEVRTAVIDGAATISVENTGPTIAAGEVDGLFQPFGQRGQARLHTDGHGLGLAIVMAIAGAHRATLAAHPRRGGGLAVDVRFSADCHANC